MAPVYKLTYFDFMGVGEPIRYMFAYGGIQYENVIVNRKTQWPTMKQNVPFGRLPVLEMDSKVLYQPQAIARYLAKKLSLYTTDDWTNAQMDAIVETLYNFWEKVAEWHRETDSSMKSQLKKILETEYLPVYLNQFEKLVENNGGYFTGKQLTWVDIFYTGVMESMIGMWGTDFLKSKWTNLYQLQQKVLQLPAIKTYIAKRPEYEF